MTRCYSGSCCNQHNIIFKPWTQAWRFQDRVRQCRWISWRMAACLPAWHLNQTFSTDCHCVVAGYRTTPQLVGTCSGHPLWSTYHPSEASIQAEALWKWKWQQNPKNLSGHTHGFIDVIQWKDLPERCSPTAGARNRPTVPPSSLTASKYGSEKRIWLAKS